MALDAVGMRAFSLREAWGEEGTSRAPKKFREALKETATVFMGAKGYRNVVWAEEQIQDLVSYAKTTIVVRGLKVIWENMVSNQLHLMSHGIGPIEGLRGIKDKFLEANTYMGNREEITRLNLELAAKGRNAKERERISARIQALEDANRQLSIAPLLEAGELSTISENLTEADTAVREGKISDYLEKAADALPGFVGDAAKTVMITKDSALFKGLNRAVQYGDFTAKAVLYDHLTQRQGMSQEEALRVISEEFVNYDRLAGRGREYLESMGLIWFMNYKIRIMKVMGRMMRDRPATALLYAGGVGPMAGIDTVISGSLPGAWLDGRLGYAVGPEMGLNAWKRQALGAL
jgi:hypothetical protein